MSTSTSTSTSTSHGTFGLSRCAAPRDHGPMNESPVDDTLPAESRIRLPWTTPGILVGTDGSPHSRAALEYGAWLAPQLRLPLHALVVWQDPTLMWGDAYGYYGPSSEESETYAQQLAKDESAWLFPDGVPDWFSTSASRGVAARTLIDASRDAAMLVVGTRGHGGFTGLLLGSVSSACVAHAHCPVLVVREFGPSYHARG